MSVRGMEEKGMFYEGRKNGCSTTTLLHHSTLLTHGFLAKLETTIVPLPL
jgi:hypothetical protein